MLTDPTQSEMFRQSSAWQSPLLNFQLRVKQTSSSGPAYRSNSLSGNERNRLLISQNGSFKDHSLISGIDASEDSRSFALFDYDNDGWLDIALASFARGEAVPVDQVDLVYLRGSDTWKKHTPLRAI